VATDVILPSLGFDMTEGTLASWLKKEGERVEKDQAIAEIETEKATVEIVATVSGVLAKIIVKAGQTVPVGTVIGVIAEPGETFSEISEPSTAIHPPAPAPADKEKGGMIAAPSAARIKSTPVARRMANEAGIDLSRIKGSGPDGRITERDVQAAIEANPSQTRPIAGSGTPVAASAPLNRMRQAIARRMTESKASIPHFYVTAEINMDEAMNMRKQLNNLASNAEKISVNDLIVAAAAKTLPQFPRLNASYRDGNLEMHPEINIGIAVSLEDGLLPVVLRDADRKTLQTISAESKALTERAHTGKLRSEDLGSSTFTISNLGMFDVDEFIAIINPPEAAILAVGSGARRPVAIGGDVRIASLMKATLSVDHRVSDGTQAARFLQELKKRLEAPVNLLTDYAAPLPVSKDAT